MTSSQVLSAQQMAEIDRRAIEEVGISSLALMENAGAAVARQILKRRVIKRCVILCGAGHNAGDGFVTGRHLLNAGVKVDLFLLSDPEKFKADTERQWLIWNNLQLASQRVEGVTTDLLTACDEADVIVDALFGFGLNRAMTPPYVAVLKMINALDRWRVAIDVPSGLDSTTGRVHDVAFQADLTITLSCVKSGLLKQSGPRCCGEVVVEDIGIPISLISH